MVGGDRRQRNYFTLSCRVLSPGQKDKEDSLSSGPSFASTWPRTILNTPVAKPGSRHSLESYYCKASERFEGTGLWTVEAQMPPCRH